MSCFSVSADHPEKGWGVKYLTAARCYAIFPVMNDAIEMVLALRLTNPAA